jgi:ABC-type amino acid transport substrate-binding protein
MKKRCATIIIFAFTTILATVVAAEYGLARDLTQIIDSKKVVIAMVDRDFPPFITQTKGGGLEGLEVDLARDIAKELGVTLEIAKTDHFDDVIDIIASGKADIGLSNLSITCDRAKHVKFTNAYRKLGIILLINRMKIAARKLTAGIQNLEELKNTTDTIGVIERSAYETAALKYFPNAKVKTYDRYKDMILSAEKDETLLAIGNSDTIGAFLRKNPHLVVKLQPFKVPGLIDHIAMAVAVENDHLLSWLNSYIIVKGLNTQ